MTTRRRLSGDAGSPNRVVSIPAVWAAAESGKLEFTAAGAWFETTGRAGEEVDDHTDVPREEQNDDPDLGRL